MIPDFSALSLPLVIGLFIVSALVIGVTGWKLSDVADTLADRTGMGEAIAGALFLGAATSLPGIVTSVTAAIDGFAELAVSNAIGGIAAQTVFLAVADLAYRRANLEHAAASIANLMQGTLLIVLVSIPLLATTMPEIQVFGVHPATVLMFAIYIYGMHMISQARTQPMWSPRQTKETQQETPDQDAMKVGLAGLWARFAVLALIVGVAGWVVARTGVAISEQTGLSQTAVGAFLTAVATSLPELVTSVAAVRQGSQTLAVSGIIGGNAFDTLFAAVADIAYREGSIYHAITSQQTFFIVLTVLMTGILLMGLLRRQERGIANIGFESFFIMLLYVGAALFLMWNGAV
jgi:cation:H+ antiporter